MTTAPLPALRAELERAQTRRRSRPLLGALYLLVADAWAAAAVWAASNAQGRPELVAEAVGSVVMFVAALAVGVHLFDSRAS